MTSMTYEQNKINTYLPENIINEIGKLTGYNMWNNRDKTKKYYQLNSEYSYNFYENGPPNKNWIFSKTDFIHTEKYNVSSYIDWKILDVNNQLLLQFKIVGDYNRYIGIYTINLKTLQPTKNSKIQIKLTNNIIN